MARATRRRRTASAYSSARRRKTAATSCPAAASSRMNHIPVNELPPVNRIFMMNFVLSVTVESVP